MVCSPRLLSGVASNTYLSSVHINSVFVEYSRKAVPPVAATMFRNEVTPPMMILCTVGVGMVNTGVDELVWFRRLLYVYYAVFLYPRGCLLASLATFSVYLQPSLLTFWDILHRAGPASVMFRVVRVLLENQRMPFQAQHPRGLCRRKSRRPMLACSKGGIMKTNYTACSKECR